MNRDAFEIGEPVVDRDSPDDDPNTAIVVNCPPQTADEWNAYHSTTVAEDNPDYPEDAAVVVVAYRDELAEFDPDWADHDEPFSLGTLNEGGVSHYAYPAPRLTSIATDDTDEIDEADDESTNTDVEDQAESDSDQSTTDVDESPTDAEETAADADEPPEDPEPSADVRALKETLTEHGLPAEIEPTGRTVVTKKLGVTYRLEPGELLEGDGPHRDQIEEIATKV